MKARIARWAARSSRSYGPAPGPWCAWLVTLAVLCGLHVFVVNHINGNRLSAGTSWATVSGDFQSLVIQLKTYQMLTGTLPTTEQGLSALVTMPTSPPKPRNWFQLMTQFPKDPWGNEYIYHRRPLKGPMAFDLISKGPDGREATDDDLYCEARGPKGTVQIDQAAYGARR